MMKHHYQRNSLIFFSLIILFLFQSCTQVDFKQEETLLEQQEQAMERQQVLERIASMGYNTENVIELEDAYIIEGDLKFSKNINDYVSSSRSNQRGGIQLIQDHYTYKAINLFTPAEVGDIKIYSEISQNVFGDPWFTAINRAINDWNSVGTCINMYLVNDEDAADIRILETSGTSLFAWADLPNLGATTRTVYVNTNYENGSTTPQEKHNLITHELGHCLGFGHNSFPSQANIAIPGIIPEATSIMDGGILDRIPSAIGLTANDIAAARYLYNPQANCSIGTSTGGGTTGSINGASSICASSLPTTYTWNGSGNVTWTVSSNLSISNSTGTNVQVTGVSAGTGTITAEQNGNTVATKTVQVGSRPTPSGSAAMSGPTLLKYYQTGSFYTSSSSFSNSNYTNIDWVVFSYNFQNASQHFRVRHTDGFHSTVEVLPTAPEGSYTVQFRISNSCGTYYIDKAFTVQAGPPQLFE